MPAHILIVDDHYVVREGVRTLLASHRPAWELTEAGDGGAAIEAIEKRENPDLIVMDITMPGVNGLEAASRLRELGFVHPILIFTMHELPGIVNLVQQAGAQGYVLKSQAVADLVQAIDTLLGGGTFVGGGPEPEGGVAKPSRRFSLFHRRIADFA